MVAALADHEVICVDPKLDGSMNYPLAVPGCDAVIHLAANADVRDGWSNPTRDLTHNTVHTGLLLEYMRQAGVRRLLFASSSAIYGDAPTPTLESHSGQQTSLYGASKLACEGLIGAYAAAGHISASIFRLTSMLGPHYRHGLIKDFYDQITQTNTLTVLGGGGVPRTRMDVTDGVSAFLSRLPHNPDYEVFNVGTYETVTSLEVAQQVATLLDYSGDINIVGESWVGDHPILLSTAKLRMTGWETKYTIAEGITRTVEWLTR